MQSRPNRTCVIHTMKHNAKHEMQSTSKQWACRPTTTCSQTTIINHKIPMHPETWTMSYASHNHVHHTCTQTKSISSCSETKPFCNYQNHTFTSQFQILQNPHNLTSSISKHHNHNIYSILKPQQITHHNIVGLSWWVDPGACFSFSFKFNFNGISSHALVLLTESFSMCEFP